MQNFLKKYLKRILDVCKMDEKDIYLEFFGRSKWIKTHRHQRLFALQAIETEYAKKINRPIAIVYAPKKIKDNKLIAEYQHSSWEPVINLNPARLEDNANPENQYLILESVIHEGRHAYQRYIIEHPELHSNQIEVEAWLKNWKIDPKEIESYRYRFQPIEKDAHEFALQEIKTLKTFYENKYGKEENLTNYIKARIEMDNLAVKRAKDSLGEFFIQEINKKIEDEYMETDGKLFSIGTPANINSILPVQISLKDFRVNIQECSNQVKDEIKEIQLAIEQIQNGTFPHPGLMDSANFQKDYFIKKQQTLKEINQTIIRIRKPKTAITIKGDPSDLSTILTQTDSIKSQLQKIQTQSRGVSR